MPMKKRRIEDRFTLVATIQSVERRYYISEESKYRWVDDEATLLLTGTIEQISPRYERQKGKQIEMLLLCAQSFSRDHAAPAAEQPFLMSVNFRGVQPSLGAYLPSDAFWALAEMIKSKDVTHIEADFSSSRSGSAELLSLHFAPVSGLVSTVA